MRVKQKVSRQLNAGLIVNCLSLFIASLCGPLRCAALPPDSDEGVTATKLRRHLTEFMEPFKQKRRVAEQLLGSSTFLDPSQLTYHRPRHMFDLYTQRKGIPWCLAIVCNIFHFNSVLVCDPSGTSRDPDNLDGQRMSDDTSLDVLALRKFYQLTYMYFLQYSR